MEQQRKVGFLIMNIQEISEKLTLEQRRIFLEKWNKVKSTEYADKFLNNVSKKLNESNTPNCDSLKSQGRVALRKIAVATPLNSKAPVLTHKSYCSKCNRVSFITWLTYPNERNKKLGCAVCRTIINPHEVMS